MKKVNMEHLTLGLCYYPEHWDKSLWREDLQRMKALGIETVRIAEFAWNFFEPHEGEFTFDFFDSFMKMAEEEHMQVIFCTPTATPPAWMSEKYPEILNADIDGHLIHHGYRRHCNFNSEKYLFFTKRIVQNLAEHYGKHPNIVAWQLDNEINCGCTEYFSESDHNAFRSFLQKRFGTLEALNKAIGAAFWNQTYTDWAEVHLPRRTIPGVAGSNPHMELLQKRFTSDTIIRYFKLQADIIRAYSNAPITTNGLFANIEYHRLTEEALDYITYDNYPNFGHPANGKAHALRDRKWSYNLTRTRSISPVFGIMEQQSGLGGTVANIWQIAPKPGQMRLWTFQAMAHGADFVNYFRWRTCTFGTEIHWHGLLNYSGRDNRRTAELKAIYEDVQKVQGMCGKTYVAEVALLKDYDNEWDWDVWHTKADSISYDGWFCALQKKHIPFDLVYVNDQTTAAELAKYKTVIYPHASILTEPRATMLKAYAEQGGTVLFGCRTGYKNVHGGCVTEPIPGFAAPLCGAEIEEYTFTAESEAPQFVQLGNQRVPAPYFNDVLTVTDGTPVGIYENNYYSRACGAAMKLHGAGKVYYFGAAFSENAAAEWIRYLALVPPCRLDERLKMPEEIELAVRGEYIFLLNYTENEVTVPCADRFEDLLSGNLIAEQLVLPPYGVAVLRQA